MKNTISKSFKACAVLVVTASCTVQDSAFAPEPDAMYLRARDNTAYGNVANMIEYGPSDSFLDQVVDRYVGGDTEYLTRILKLRGPFPDLTDGQYTRSDLNAFFFDKLMPDNAEVTGVFKAAGIVAGTKDGYEALNLIYQEIGPIYILSNDVGEFFTEALVDADGKLVPAVSWGGMERKLVYRCDNDRSRPYQVLDEVRIFTHEVLGHMAYDIGKTTIDPEMQTGGLASVIIGRMDMEQRAVRVTDKFMAENIGQCARKDYGNVDYLDNLVFANVERQDLYGGSLDSLKGIRSEIIEVTPLEPYNANQFSGMRPY